MSGGASRRSLPVVRTGECTRCGDCCVGDPYSPHASDAPCPHLRRDESGLASCEIHGQPGTYWDQGCRVWPTKPEHVVALGRCTYRFEAVS